MDKERAVVAHDFLGLERSPCIRQGEERNGDRNIIQRPTASFPTFENRSSPSVAMSLRTRENSAMALKRIFDQINATSENCKMQDLDTEETGKRRLPFPEGTGEDGKRRGGLPQQAVKATESSFNKPLDDFRETDFGQRTRDMRGAWIESQDGGNLLSLCSRADGEGRRIEGKAGSCSHRGADIQPLSAFSPLQQRGPVFDKSSMFGLQTTEMKASPSPQLPQPQRRGGNLSPLYKTATGLSGPDHQLHQFGAHQQAFDHSRKRVTDLDISFQKALVQDSAALLSQQTAFDSATPSPAFRTRHPDSSPNATQWQMQGFNHPVQRFRSQSTGALRPNVPATQPTAQLTIFYSGTVNVYDDIPADKAHAIMLLAGSGNSWSSHLVSDARPRLATVSSPAPDSVKRATTSVPSTVATTTTTARTTTTVTPSMASSSPTILPVVHTPSTSVNSPEMKQNSSATPEISKQPQPQPVTKRSHAELPHARKASLARFLEKRKDRVQSKPPVNETKASETQI